MILLSKNKINELRQEYNSLKKSLIKENEEEAQRGGPMDSYKEAAAFSISKQAKAKRVEELNNILNEAKELPEYIEGKSIILGKNFVLEGKLGAKRYTLVDPVEADPSKNKISIDSPLGKAVLNKTAGSIINVSNNNLVIISVE